MKLNRKWINEEFVDLSNVSDKDFVETLTVFGQKVETYERLDSEIKNVVVGKVLSMTRHENSDHMWVCQVDVGKDEPVQIVTGAQNVHEGDLVPAALHNSYLPGGVHITKGKLRGVASNGMLCSLKELGLTLGDFPYAIEDGIWILQEDCKIGDDINTVIGNDDTVVDFEITNNRPDCYSIIGLAREAAAAFGQEMRHHEPVVHGSDAGTIFDKLDVETEATDLCSRYTARMVANVKIGPSPKWLRQRLRANGIRSINNIVDLDLFGQVNAESAGIKQISGTGGQLDFVMGAYLSKGGKSFICLSSAMKGKDGQLKSRIVPTLTPGSICTDPRSTVQYLVTEYGMINLKGLNTWERADKIISIAHPQFREDLIKDAEKMGIWRRSNKR